MQSLTYRDGNKVLVRVVPEPGAKFDFGFYGTGVAVCGQDDHFDLAIGEAIAAGRAMVDFGNQVAATAEANVITKARWRELVEEMFARFEAETPPPPDPQNAQAEPSIPSRERVWSERLATNEEQRAFADAVDAKIDAEKPSPVNIVVDSERYDQLKAEHDAAVAAMQAEQDVDKSDPITAAHFPVYDSDRGNALAWDLSAAIRLIKNGPAHPSLTNAVILLGTMHDQAVALHRLHASDLGDAIKANAKADVDFVEGVIRTGLEIWLANYQAIGDELESKGVDRTQAASDAADAATAIALG